MHLIYTYSYGTKIIKIMLKIKYQIYEKWVSEWPSDSWSDAGLNLSRGKKVYF